MRRERTTIALDDQSLVIQVTDDQSRTLIDPITNVAYHSASGAVAETQHVYLHNSLVLERLRAGLDTSVLEIGLGIGLGALLTFDAAIKHGTKLTYTAVENKLLSADVLRQLELHHHVNDSTIVSDMIHWRESLGNPVPDGPHHWNARDDQRLTVIHQDAREWADNRGTYDAIYFDPFSPEENPDLWQPSFLSRMHALVNKDGRFVTYCVSRRVRDDLESVGFSVSRVPGPPGGKREVLVASP